MARHIEPALLRGEVFNEGDSEVLGAWDNLDFDTPQQRLADHAGIQLDQAARALTWFAGEEREAVFEAAAEMLGRMFDTLIPHKQNSEALKAETCGLRLVAARVLLNRSGGDTLTAWAARLGCSKQLLSWHIKQIEDSVGLHWLGGKRQETRETFAESARSRWAALTPEQRRERRAGYKPAEQDALPAAQI